jgi:hypothetical protein
LGDLWRGADLFAEGARDRFVFVFKRDLDDQDQRAADRCRRDNRDFPFDRTVPPKPVKPALDC